MSKKSNSVTAMALRHHRLLACLGTSSLALSSPTWAQEAPSVDTEASATTEIIVEARRRDESAQDVPLVVHAVTSDDIQKLNLRDFKEITSLVPGLQMANNSNGIGTTSSIRGVNYDVNASGNNGTIEYYLNDAPISSGPLFLSMYDVGQIEVLRGPQGTLRGRASPSGSITIANKRPDLAEIGGYAQGTATDFGGFNVNAALGVPIITDVLAVRVAGLIDHNEGNRIKSINNPLTPRNRTNSGRVSVRFEPTSFISLGGMYQRVEVKATQFDQVVSFNNFAPSAPASAIPISSNDRRSDDDFPRAFTSTYDIFTWYANVGFAGQRLYYVGGNTKQHIISTETADFGNFFKENIFSSGDTRANATSHEIRLQNEDRIANVFDYVIGYFQYGLNGESVLGRQTPVTLPPALGGGIAATANTAITRPNQSKEQSYFGNITAHIGSNTELSGGIRHIKYRAEASLAINGAVLAAANEDLKFSHTIYTASVKHRISDDMMVYASFGSSFRPGISAVGDFSLARSPLENSFLVLPPETSKSYEIGFKSSLFDKRLKLNVSAYQQDFKNYPYRSSSGIYFLNYSFVNGAVVPGVSQFNFVAAVPVRVRGFEAELAYSPNNHLSFSANVSYARGRITNATIPCNDFNGDGKPDVVTNAPTLTQLQGAVGANNISACPGISQRSANASPWGGSFQAEYNTPISSNANGFLRGLLNFQGSAQGDPSNPFDDRGSYGLLNLYAGVRSADGTWEISAFAKNLTNNRTLLSVGNGPRSTSYQQLTLAGFNGATPVLGAPTAQVFNSSYADATSVAPREFGITARFAFGSR
jgi:iron complex outermembrane recepter protein